MTPLDVPLNVVLLVAAVMFTCGVVCMATKRNAIGILIGVELVLNSSNLNFVAFGHYTRFGIDGHMFALFGIVLPAAEAAIALAIILNFYNNHLTVDVDRADELKQ
jgi:NADH-quinone oxidoreductase subunit K